MGAGARYGRHEWRLWRWYGRLGRRAAPLTQADEPDRAAIEKQIDKIQGIQAALQKPSTWAMLDARKLLTLPQKKRLDQLLAERRGGPGGREMGMGGGFQGGGEPDGPGGP